MNTRVLVIDDQQAITELVTAILTDEGFEVQGVNESSRAYHIAKTYQPDVIILDIMMPVMNGWDVLQQLRGDATLTDTPVIIMSAHIRQTDMHAAKQKYRYVTGLPKPFDISELVAVVEQVSKWH